MKIIKNYLYVLSYQIFLLIVPFITMPYVSRIIGPTGLGINAFVGSINSYFAMLAVLGLSVYGQREIAYVSKFTTKVKKIFWEIEYLSIITTIISIILYFIFILFYPLYTKFFYIYLINIVAVIFDVSWLLIGLQSFKKLAYRNFLVKIIALILIFTFVKSSSDIYVYIYILVGSTLLGNLLLWPTVLRIVGLPTAISIKPILRHLRNSIILFIPQIATLIYTSIDRSMLGFFGYIVHTSYFDNSDKIIRMAFSSLLSLSTVMMPSVATKFANEGVNNIRPFIIKSLKFSLALVIPMAIGIILLASQIIHILLGSNFSGAVLTLQIQAFIMIPMGIANVVGNQILFPLKKNYEYNKAIIIGTIISFIVSIPLCFFYKSYGASIAVLIVEIVVMILQFKYQNIINIKNIFDEFWKIMFSVSFMGVFLLLTNERFSSLIYTIIIIIFSIIIYLFSLWILKYSLVMDVSNRISFRKIFTRK